MSTSIKEITGIYHSKTEHEEGNIFNPKLEECSLDINRFAGGINGTMLQLTICNNNDGYIMFTEDKIKDLIKVLTKAFDTSVYPSD